MSGRIRTTGEMRNFLVETMQDVRDGLIDLDKASRITKMAGQVNESFYAEVKVAKTRTEAGENMPLLGEMAIGSMDK